MTCEDVKKQWEKFLNGDCSTEDEERIETHIKQCETCSMKFAKVLDEQESSIKKTAQITRGGLNIKKQQRILKKARWKQRFSTALSLIGMLIVLTIVGSVLTNLYFSIGEKSKLERVDEVLTTITEMTEPNMTLRGRGSNLSPYFTTKIETQITKRLGGDYGRPVGTLKANMLFSLLDVEREWDRSGGLDVKMHFLNPHYDDPDNNLDEWMDENWEQLEKVKDSTVAEVAITLDKNYSIKEAQQLFSMTHSEVVWLAVDTGDARNDPDWIEPYVSQIDKLWGLPIVPHSRVLSGEWKHGPDEYERTEEKKWFGKVVSESSSYEIPNPEEQTFLDGLRFLKENKRWAKAYPKFYTSKELLTELDRVETYVDEHGVEVYGVVVTGPTDEIIKLKDSPRVKYISVGDIDWWNLGGGNYSGTMY